MSEMKDGLALRAIRNTDGFAALEHLLARKKESLFEAWAAKAQYGGREITQEWSDGYLAALRDFMQDVDELIARAQEAKSLSAQDRRAALGGDEVGRGEVAL